jgi:hypothetical protein
MATTAKVATSATPTPTSSSTVLVANQIAQFDPDRESWTSFFMRSQVFVQINGFNEDQIRASLIGLLSPKVFEQLFNDVLPEEPLKLAYEVLMEKLEEMFETTVLVDAYKDSDGKSFLDQALRLAFTMGLADSALRRQLLGKTGLTVSEALAHAQRHATVREGEKARRGEGSSRVEKEEIEISAVHKQQSGRLNKSSPRAHKDQSSARTPQSGAAHSQQSTSTKCPECESTQHARSACPFRNAVCHNCKKIGHIKRACRSKQVHEVADDIMGSIFQIEKSTCPACTVKVKLNGHNEILMLDTGAAVSIVNTQTWRKMGQPKLDTRMKSYRSSTGHRLIFKGHTKVAVSIDGKTLNLPVPVTSSGVNLMGRDWIRAFSLDKEPLSAKEPAVGDVNAIQEMDKAVKSVIDRYPEVFAPGLGHCKKMKARLVLKENARPPFIKARPVPYAMSPELEKELDRWQSLGIISPIPHSDCAAPLVIVRKPNGSLRLCADFSTGLNAALKIDQYPLPKPTDLFTKLNGAKYFTKIDFSEAYLQIEVDDAAKKLLVINTPKGLFAFNRLPFGVASAPAIFQQEMEKMLQGIKDVAVYLDDILVVSKTKEGHLRTLDKVLQRISEYGFRISAEKCSFLQTSVEYLGFVVDEQGRHASPKKTEAIVKMPAPENISQLRSLLGMINHYAQFLPRRSDHLAPMNRLHPDRRSSKHPRFFAAPHVS